MSLTVELLSFADALDAARAAGGRLHVLLGNGFSIGANDLFRYGTLYEQARQQGLPNHLDALFRRYGTTNFEEVLRQLDEAAWLSDHYKLVKSDPALDMRRDYELLKEILAQTLASVHPGTRNDVDERRLKAASQFLDNFHDVFTTNYDLLLYWASLVQEPFPFRDGFGREEDTEDDHCVFLQTRSGARHIYFLHGALHLYTSAGEVRKMIWSNTGIPLIEQVQTALAQKRYPLVVAEGRAEHKAVQIEGSSYLSHCWRRLENIQGSLFVYGSSLSQQDDHLLEAIAKNVSLPRLYVGLHGSVSKQSNRQLVVRAQMVVQRREAVLESGRTGGRAKRGKLEVAFYDTRTARVWDTNETA
jgi:hypothetical protein